MRNFDALKKLAAMAPHDEHRSTPLPLPKSHQRTPGPKSNDDLGPLDVGLYLSQNGVAHKVKPGPGEATLYTLEQCLFDPAHSEYEAAIIQKPDGLLSYQCFHNSCSGRTWREARTLISGDKSLAQFCTGYDPNWKAKHQKSVKGTRNTESSGKDFLTVNDRGRVKFIPARLADYLENQFNPLVYEGDDFSRVFYKYHKSGVWRPFPRDSIRLVVRRLLGDHAKTAWMEGAIDVLAAQTYKPPEDFEFDPMWLNLKNGMLNLKTLDLGPHDPKFNSRVQLSVSYQKDATCPLWIDTVGQIFLDNFDKVDVLQEFFGYCLYPKILRPCAVFQIGQGRNGKGVIEKILCALLGRENVSHISLARMEESFGPVEIQGKLLNSCGETEARPLDVTNFKKIVAGDEIQAQRKYLPDVTFVPFAKHLVSMNAFPGVKEKTDAFFRRIIVLEYKQKFEGEADDKRLADKLLVELDGIFKWALEGLKRVLEKEEISTPACVSLAKERFRERVNPVLAFVKEVCVLADASDDAVRVLPAELYREYQAWIEDAKLRPLGKNNFYEQVYLNFPGVMKKRHGSREFFFGIGIRVSERKLP
jgi:P4 family phage/plasmid primase-like protien